MPGERAESKLSQSFRRIVDHMQTDGEKQYVWGCVLKDEQPVTWDHTEEDDDEDFVVHTLHLKSATLGKEAKAGERNIVELETKSFDGETLNLPVASLELGKTENFSLDLELTNEIPVTFRLIEGSGPVHILAQHLVEFPADEDDEEDALTEVETCDEEEAPTSILPLKRKSSAAGKGKAKKAKLNESVEENGDDEEEDDDDEEEGDDDEEEGDGGEDEVDDQEDDADEDEEMEDEEDDSSEEEESEEEPAKPAKKVKKNGVKPKQKEEVESAVVDKKAAKKLKNKMNKKKNQDAKKNGVKA